MKTGSLDYQSFVQPQANATVRRAQPKLAENISVADFGAVGDGVTDDSAAINRAIVAVIAAGGGVLNLLNGLNYAVAESLIFPAGVNNLTLDGHGATITRTGVMAASMGVFDLQACQQVTFRNLTVDGNVTVSVGINYSTFNSDPMYAALTLNTSFWLHGGCSDIDFEQVKIQHTGGYAILSDTRTGGNNSRIRVRACNLINNRPHLFGTSNADLNYGSWTGGIFYVADCSTAANVYVTMSLKVVNCTFERGTGNQVWGHNIGYFNWHSSVEVTGNSFLDIGLDAIQISCTVGGSVANNDGRRIGYICTSDVAPSIPKYLPGLNATFIDHAGYVEGVTFSDNSCTSICGGFCSLDGYAYGSVTGNNFRQPQVGDAYYTEDQIADVPAGVVYGFDCANTFNNVNGMLSNGGDGNIIVGNALYGCTAGAIIGIALRNCKIADNDIWQPGNSTFAPILLGNQSATVNQQCFGNSITGNRIYWSPATAKAAIVESENWSGGSIPWLSGEANWIEKNHIFSSNGNAFEAGLAPSSSSITGWQISSNVPNPTAAGFMTFTRVTAANGSGGYLSLLGTTGTEYFRFADSGVLTVNGGVGTGVAAYLFNSTATGSNNAIQTATGTFSITGAGNALFQTAICTTVFSSRSDLAGSPSTTAAFQTSTGTMVIYGDGHATFQYTSVNYYAFVGLAAAPTAPSAGNAKLYYDTVIGALRYNLGGAGWVNLVGGGTPGGANTQVQFNNSGAFGGSANLTWNGTILNIGAGNILISTTGALVAGNIQSGQAGVTTGGYYVTDSGFVQKTGYTGTLAAAIAASKSVVGGLIVI